MKNGTNHISTQTSDERVFGDLPAAITFKEKGLNLSDLHARFKGRVITPEDADYKQACTVFYGGIEKRPAVIIRVADAEDVANVIALARDTGLELAVRSGGHSSAGFALSEGGIVLDLREMHALDIDAENRTAWAETGLTAGELTTAADRHDLAIGFGDTGSVGIGGITLGGGVGYLVRKHGLTIDSLLAAEIVTADGQVRYADADNEPDLFWAVRGGGGNFGVATRFKYQLHEMGDIYGGMLVLPVSPESIAGFIAEAEAAPEELSTIANIMTAPPLPFLPAELHGKLINLVMLVYAGDVDAGMEATAPFRKLAQPLADMLQPTRYPAMIPPEEGDYHPTAVGHTMFIERIDVDAAKTIYEFLQASDASMRVAQLRVMGGAVSRVPNDATAYAHRHRRIMANLAAFYTTPEDQETRQRWVNDFAAALHQGDGAYVNFLALEGEERLHSAYPGATWERLRAIKTQYDPGNLFRLNQNIPPKQ